MPQVGAWLAAVWTGAKGAAAAFALKTAASVALNLALAKLTAPKGPRPQEIATELRSSAAQRVRHLGRVRASGAVMFWDWTHVGGARRLFKLIAVAEGGMQDVHQWYLDGEPVEVDVDGFVTTEPWNKGNIRLRFRRGIQGDQWDGGAFPALQSAFPDQWTANHRLRGVGCILATFDAVGGEDIGDVYPGGEPEVSALISGAPQWRPISESWSQVRAAAVLLGDVLTNPTYGALTGADLDLPSLTAATAACTETVPTAGGTRPRYQAGISYALSDGLKDTAQKLLDAMGGRAWITPEGKLAIQAGVWVPPTVTIEERHIVEMDYSAGTERISRVTTLVPSYVAPEVEWQESTADPWDDDAAIARWGEGEPKGVDLLAVQHHGQARHVCKQMLAVMNPARRMTFKLRSSGLRLMGERVCAVNIPRLGLVNTPFWIDSFGWDGTNVTVDLIEADPASFNWTAAEEGSPPAVPEEIDRTPAELNTPITSVTVVTNDGVPYIRITGTLVSQAGYQIFAQFRRSSSRPNGPWTNMVRETSPAGQYMFRTQPLGDRVDYDIRTFIGLLRDGEYILQSTPVEVQDIDVVANNNPPAAPVVVSEDGVAGGTLTVVFMPDLGANYFRTGLYRAPAGGNWGQATFIKWSYDTSSDVTMTAPIPGAGARFWLQSENHSEIPSDPVVVGNYPA
ncbi:hypothetical protein [Paracoccus siganidrum]|uniref:Tip attachment protein J domain-containing protein n=1 Tax=Paracoccus siganidrum TaxID=1276757 RepID=A0A419A408_9RHOB|nr:hypothetical protein [Paracoccus siganidrum]RJL08406.1 hypothetical protein D3P05_16175 [Paracoccus siganidrum]RMC39317.1 hypothetical protein C9E82_04885 [Paracoccus siganidrum]